MAQDWRRRLFERLFDHRRLVLSGSVLVALACLVAGTGLVWREDVMDLLPAEDPVIAEYRRILTDFGQLDAMLVAVGPAPSAAALPEGKLIQAADAVADRMRTSGLFESITYRMDALDFTAALDVLREHRASLFTRADEATLAARLAPGAVRSLLGGWKRQLTENPAPYLAQALVRDPLGLDELLVAKLGAAQSFDGPVRIEQGRLMSRDRRYVLLLARPNSPATDSQRAQALVDFMDRTAAEVAAPQGSGVRLAYLSGHRFSLENASRIKGDLRLTLTISLTTIALISLAVFRRPLWVGLTFLPTLFGGVFALGVLRLLVPDISAIAIGCGSMLLGIAVDLGIHILCHVDRINDERPRREQIVEILARLFWPLLLCAATTIAAFLALVWSVLPGYRSLGQFAALGFAGATLFAVFVLPLLVPLKRGRTSRQPLVPVARVFPAFFAWSARHRRLVAVVLAVSAIGCLPGFLRLGFEGDYQKMNAVSEPVKRDWDLVNQVFGSALPSSSVVVRGGTLEASLAENERVYGLLRDLQQRGVVTSVQSVAPLLPSATTQAGARQRWRGFWSAPRVAALRESLEVAAAELRMRPGVFAPFLTSLQAETAPLTPADLQQGVFRHLLARHVAIGAAGVPVLTSFDLPAGAEAAEVFGALRAAGIRFGSIHGPDLFGHIVHLIQQEMLWVSAISIALVMLILVGYYRALRDLALILLPLLLGLYWTFGIMGWAGLRVNLMNSLIVVFVFGVVVDYSLFLATALARAPAVDDPHLTTSSVGIVVSGLTTLIGLGVLVAARHPALHSIGITSLLGIGTGLLAVFTVIPLARPAGGAVAGVRPREKDACAADDGRMVG